MVFFMKNEARLFKALADETRLRILALLLGGELCVCEIIAALALPQSTISRHLAYLRNAGWVQDRRQGMWMYYRLAEAGQPLASEMKPLLQKHLAGCREHAVALTRLADFRKGQEQQAC